MYSSAMGSEASKTSDNVRDSDAQLAKLDAVIDEGVSFVKVDVEGHELNVLHGARALIARSRPVFLVEAENRHRPDAVASVASFFAERDYEGFYLRRGGIIPIEAFEPEIDQDESVLHSDGARADGRHYINNFFFFPAEREDAAELGRALSTVTH